MSATAPILTQLIEQARAETEKRKQVLPLSDLEELIAEQKPTRDFKSALRRGNRLAVIAEMKRRTPSAGLLAPRYRPGLIARSYYDGGADAISVLTHQGGFGGYPDHLVEARQTTELPILRKDFVIDEHQVVEARALGADAVLLIVAALEPGRLRELVALARSLGLDALVEAHDERELAAALESGTGIVGVNHRDLRTFLVDLSLTERLRPLVPADVVYVAESGVHGPLEARRMREAGADAVLVGESLMRAVDVRWQLHQLAVRDGS